MFVEVDDFGALLKAEESVEVGALAAVERDRFLDVIGDAGAFLGALENDADREWPLADYRLIGSRDGDEIWKIHDVSLRRRTAFADDDRVERDLYVAAAVIAFEVGFAQDTVTRAIVRTALRAGCENRAIGARPQHE